MSRAGRIAGGLVSAATIAGAGYLAYAGVTYARYGRPARPRREADRDSLLDALIPEPEVVERHRARVAASAAVTLAAAREVDLLRSPVVRAVFRAREVAMRAPHAARPRRPRPFLDEVLSLGWGILAEEPDRELVLGAVTRPWEADVVFRAIPADEFAGFGEPGYAKIAWTLAARPLAPDASEFRTETRVVTTDPDSRERFRRYWALVSPGIRLIRRAMLPVVRAEAERRVERAPPRRRELTHTF